MVVATPTVEHGQSSVHDEQKVSIDLSNTSCKCPDVLSGTWRPMSQTHTDNVVNQ